MAYYARVKTEAPSHLKFDELGDLLEINPMWAFGMSVAIWCLCWEFEFLDGRLKRFTAKTLARRLKWDGDAEKLVDALVKANVLERDTSGTLIAHDWVDEQNGGIKILLRNRGREQAASPQPTEGKSGDDTVTKTLLEAMRECAITGAPAIKREHIAAWRHRGLVEKAHALIMGEGRGQEILWISKKLNGAGDSRSQSTNKEILENWAREGDAKDAAAAKQKGEKK